MDGKGRLNGLDLFSGIGGLTVALEPWVRPIAYCEVDRHAVGVLLSRMASGDIPIAPVWDDVKTLTRTHITPPVDIIYGGFPCQDLSFAGRGAGLDGERSGLFFQIVRLVGELRPRFVFLENVAAITVRGGERVAGELCRLGYDCRWGVLSASDVGAPHRRDRWWLLAHTVPPGEWGDEREGETPEDVADGACDGAQGWLPDGKRSVPRHDGDAQPLAEELADAQGVGFKHSVDGASRQDPPRGINEQPATGTCLCRKHERIFDREWWATEPDVGRVAHGVPSRVDRLHGLGNAVVPAQAREAFQRLMGLK